MLLTIRRHINHILRLAACLVMAFGAVAPASAYSNRIHCEEDTLLVSKLLALTAQNGGTFGERCAFVAKQLSGIPIAPPADADSLGTIMINFHGMDPLGFVNNVMAIAEASRQKLPRVKVYEDYLEKFSRRKGEDLGFTSRLFYGADWIVDNIYRGNLKEMTEYMGGGGFKVKTLDHLTRNREKYPALKDDAAFDKVRMTEMGYRGHRIPHLKKQSIGNKELHDMMESGDIIMLLSPEPDYDIYDIGFVDMIDGVPYLIHLSNETQKVTVDPYPIMRLFKLENQHFYGYRWLRPTS